MTNKPTKKLGPGGYIHPLDREERIQEEIDKICEEAFKQLEEEKPFKIGDRVVKIKGYTYNGIVVGKYKTLAGKERIIVELDSTPLQHIFNPSQFRLADDNEATQILIITNKRSK